MTVSESKTVTAHEIFNSIDKVLITIHKENVASRAVAEVNGAILEKETEDRAYYWIESGR